MCLAILNFKKLGNWLYLAWDKSMILNEGGISINWQKCCMIPVALTPGMEGSLEDQFVFGPWQCKYTYSITRG
jgi:hypothetical protein